MLWAGLQTADCSEIVNWLADAQPEVAAQCITRSGAHCPNETRAKLRAKWLPRLTDWKREPEPQARAALGRALGQIKLDDQTGLDNRRGVGLTADGLPDIDGQLYPYKGKFDKAKGNTRETGIGMTSAVARPPSS